ncbi:hypothetical protein GCM10007919_38910 [Rhizobium indigoferae]|nr:hypothetical protein GCM10007919_38910 [Rhizobium indigoferae]
MNRIVADELPEIGPVLPVQAGDVAAIYLREFGFRHAIVPGFSSAAKIAPGSPLASGERAASRDSVQENSHSTPGKGGNDGPGKGGSESKPD